MTFMSYPNPWNFVFLARFVDQRLFKLFFNHLSFLIKTKKKARVRCTLWLSSSQIAFKLFDVLFGCWENVGKSKDFSSVSPTSFNFPIAIIHKVFYRRRLQQTTPLVFLVTLLQFYHWLCLLFLYLLCYMNIFPPFWFCLFSSESHFVAKCCKQKEIKFSVLSIRKPGRKHGRTNCTSWYDLCLIKCSLIWSK